MFQQHKYVKTFVASLQNLENRHAQLKMINDKNNKDTVNELKTEYWKLMETKSVNPPLSAVDFKNSHDAGLNEALAKFQARRIRPSSYPSDVFKEELVKVTRNIKPYSSE